jgi:ADP-ribosylglycohydrolase
MLDESIALARAERSLLGLSVGDAFGERFFASSPALEACLVARSMVGGPPPPWPWSDDTAMAIEVVACLRAQGRLASDVLADALLRRYLAEPWRGYGGGAHRYFQSRSEGQPWARAAASLFEGQGSLGNGAAMRSGPIGAYFAEDLDRVVEQAELAARVTHVHVDGVAGAIAVAVAAAMAVRTSASPRDEAAALLLAEVRRRTPPGWVSDGIAKLEHVPLAASIASAATRLGRGHEIAAHDTVPFCLWAILRNLRDYEAGLWDTVSAGGDRDTTCAIVGSVLALAAPASTLPREWVAAREPLNEA